MNKLLVFGTMILVILALAGTDDARATSKDGLLAHWKMQNDSGIDSHNGSRDLTEQGSVTCNATAGRVGDGCGSWTNTNRFTIAGGDFDNLFPSSESTLCYWMKPTGSCGSLCSLPSRRESAGSPIYENFYTAATTAKLFVSDTGFEDHDYTSTLFDVDNWHYVCWVHSDGGVNQNVSLYVNGSFAESYQFVTITPIAGIHDFSIGDMENFDPFPGYFDEVSFWNTTKNETIMKCLYNNGPGLAFEDWEATCDGATPPGASNFTITITNENTFSAHIDGTHHNTTTGTITTGILQDNNTLHDIIITATDYFNKTYLNYNVSSDISTTLHQAEVTLAAYTAVTNNQTGGTFQRNGTNVTGVQQLMAGSYNFTFINDSYYNQELIYTVPALFNGTINITGVHDTILSIIITNAYTGQAATNISGWAHHNTTGYNESYNNNGTIATLNILKGLWTIFADTEGYSITTANYKQANITNTTHLLNFSLYSTNSILTNIYDENTGSLITTNITVTVSGNITETIYYTITGSLFIENITDGAYTIKFQGGNYTLKSYSITVADRSFQVLNAYLSLNSEEVIFTFLDFDSSATLPGVDISMYRIINSSWTVVESKQSDISGRAQFQYTPGVKYRFNTALTDYTTNIFFLDPIIFASYNVRLTKVTTITNAQDYLGVSIIYYPIQFYTNKTNNFNWAIQSPIGVIETYSMNITYTGGNGTFTGNNAIGEEFTHSFNITGAAPSDKVNVTYCYDITLGSNRCFSFSYSIIGAYDDQTFIANRDKTYGLGLFSRVIITTLITIVVAGLITLAAGAIIGASLGLFILGFLSSIGFIPLWAILPSLLVGFVVLSMRSSE